MQVIDTPGITQSDPYDFRYTRDMGTGGQSINLLSDDVKSPRSNNVTIIRDVNSAEDAYAEVYECSVPFHSVCVMPDGRSMKYARNSYGRFRIDIHVPEDYEL